MIVDKNIRQFNYRDDRATFARAWRLDLFSTAIHFRGWRELPDAHVWPIPIGYEPLTARAARSWLLREGWRLCGRIALGERPGAI